jgi:hypothetical protein
MAKRIRSPRFPQLALPANLRAWLNSPGEQALRERMRRLRDLPQERALREQLRQLRDLLETPPRKKDKRTYAGGRPPILTDDEIDRLQAVYRMAEPAIRRRERKQSDDVFEELRRLLPKNKHGISDPTLRRLIVRPLRHK